MSPRARFFAALALFVAWVAFLGYLAATSSEKPPGRPAASEASGARG